MEPKRLYRSKKEKIIAGICGGMGEYFDIDPIWPRLIFVLLTIADGVGILLYIVAWILIPKNPDQKDTKKTKAEETAERLMKKKRPTAGMIIGIILVILGILFLFKYMFSWFNFNYVWPILLILLGVYVLWRRKE